MAFAAWMNRVLRYSLPRSKIRPRMDRPPVLARHETKPCAKIAPALECLAAANGSDHGGRDQRTNTGNAHEALGGSPSRLSSPGKRPVYPSLSLADVTYEPRRKLHSIAGPAFRHSRLQCLSLRLARNCTLRARRRRSFSCRRRLYCLGNQVKFCRASRRSPKPQAALIAATNRIGRDRCRPRPG
jgi:hypothetical protein